MASANPSYTDILTTTIEKRSGKLADNVLKNNALYAKLNLRGNVRTADGGTSIVEELDHAENGTAMFYSGLDTLNIAQSEFASAASFSWSQAAVAVVMSGLDQLKNSGRPRIINLMEGRLRNAESSLKNLLTQALYSDGSGFGGKQLAGLDLLVPTNPATGTVGGINRANFTFWRSQISAPGTGVITAANINTYMNSMYASLSRGTDHPDLIVAGNTMWGLYTAHLQNLQRVADVKVGELGFPTLKFIGADIVLDGGIGGFCNTNTMFFLNTDWIFLRPHVDRNFVPLNPEKRYAPAQDAVVQLIGFAGQMTSNGLQFQGRLHNN